MKRLTAAILGLLLIAAFFTGCGGGNRNSSVAEPSPQAGGDEAQGAEAQGAPEDPAAPENNSTLVMATEAGFRPYEYYQGTEVVGVDVDIAREIAAELGRELVVEDMEFGAVIPSVDSGKADFGAAGMSITEERKEQVDFTIEYATTKQVILVQNDSAIHEAGDLEGKNIGVQLGTTADLALSEEADYPGVKVERYNKYMDAANDLLAGRIDAIVMDIVPAQEILKMDDSLVVREKELFTEQYAFCVKKGNTEMLDAINGVMQRLLDEGKIAEFTANHSAE